MKDLQEPEPPLAEAVLPKDSSGIEVQDDQEEEATKLAREADTDTDHEERAKQKVATSGKAGASGDTVRYDDKGDEEGGKKDDKNDAEKDGTSAGFNFHMTSVFDRNAKTNDKKDDKNDDKKDGEQDGKKDNDNKEPKPRAAERTAPRDQEQIGKISRVDAKAAAHLLEQAATVHKESCILKTFHMSLRSHNCLKQFL